MLASAWQSDDIENYLPGDPASGPKRRQATPIRINQILHV